MAERPHTGVALRLWLLSGLLTAGAGHVLLRRRRARGQEDPARWREKLGEASAPRPEGPLVWMHAVGVGEVLALPGLAAPLRRLHPGVNILITSTSRTSGEALAPNLPEGALHQYLPVDSPRFIRAFLDHWRPDVSVWAEQDIWPAMVAETADRGIPLLLVNGRMNAASLKARRRLAGLYRDLYGRFDWIGLQDAASRANFAALGVPAGRLHVSGSLKAGAPPLADQPERREELAAALAGRRVWIAASTHPGEEEIVAAAQVRLLRTDPAACLIVAPRDPGRALEVARMLATHSLRAEALPSDNRLPGPADAYVVGRIGQLGLWFRLAETAFVGGSLVGVGGHNPYEPARLGCALLHGPHVGNFAGDYAAFHAAAAAREVSDAASLAAAVVAPDLAGLRAAAAEVAGRGEADLRAVAEVIAARLPAGTGAGDPAARPGAGAEGAAARPGVKGVAAGTAAEAAEALSPDGTGIAAPPGAGAGAALAPASASASAPASASASASAPAWSPASASAPASEARADGVSGSAIAPEATPEAARDAAPDAPRDAAG